MLRVGRILAGIYKIGCQEGRCVPRVSGIVFGFASGCAVGSGFLVDCVGFN